MATVKKSFVTPRATARNWELTFGLVRVPIGMTTVFKDSDRIEGHKLCPIHQKPIKLQNTCTVDGHSVAAPITGFTVDGETVILSVDEQDALKMKGEGTIELKSQTEASNVPTVYFDTPYYAFPQSDKALKPYALLFWWLQGTGRVLIGEGVAWGSQRTFVVTYDQLRGCMVVYRCQYSSCEKKDDLKLIHNIELPDPNEKELGLATQILDALPKTYDWENVRDKVADHQRYVIYEKLETGSVTVSDHQEAEAPDDLQEQLRQSLALV